jgi:DNA-binding MarR family transcriptional regulator
MAQTRRQVPAGLTLDEELVGLLVHVAKRMTAHVDEQVGRYDLTKAQAMLLRSLDQPMPMNQVAMKLECDASNVTGIVDRLEARGLLRREAPLNDRRVKHLVLTEEGRRVRKKLDQIGASTPGLDRMTANDKRKLRELLATLM